MLSDDNDNQSGLFSIMGGSIVVVLAGLAIALHVQNGSVFSKSMMGTATGSGNRRNRNRATAGQPIRKCPVRPPTATNGGRMTRPIKNILRQLRNLDQRRTTLKASRADLQSSIDRLHEEFPMETPRENLGRGNRRVVGRPQDPQRPGVPPGSVITEIDEVGLKIKHQDGSARVKASELDPARHDRFQWSDEERLNKLKQEEQLRLYQETAPRETEPARDKGRRIAGGRPTKQVSPKADPAKLEKFSAAVSGRGKKRSPNSAPNPTRPSPRRTPDARFRCPAVWRPGGSGLPNWVANWSRPGKNLAAGQGAVGGSGAGRSPAELAG